MQDWLKIEIPEDPDIEDDKGFSSYLHEQGIAEDKMENQLEIMAKEIVTSKTNENNKPIRKQKSDNKRVFIVHGTDYEPVKELKAILQEVEIKPIILHEQPSKGMTIIEKLEEYAEVGFAFVILTPDDVGVKRQIILESYGAYNIEKAPTNSEIIKWAKGISSPIAEFLLDRIQPRHRNSAGQNVVLRVWLFHR